MRIDYENCRVLLEDGRVIKLSLIQTKILYILYENAGKVVTYKELAKYIYNTTFLNKEIKIIITTAINTIKKKIKRNIEIKNVRGVGYLLKK
jgi:DNA-binding response OmpR family regulator